MLFYKRQINIYLFTARCHSWHWTNRTKSLFILVSQTSSKQIMYMCVCTCTPVYTHCVSSDTCCEKNRAKIKNAGGTGILYMAFGLLREGLSEKAAFKQTPLKRWGLGGLESASKHLGLSVAGRWRRKRKYSG